MAQFKLLGGSHSEPDGKVYEFKKGEETIVDSPHPLDEMFGKNKFERVGHGGSKKSKATVAEAEEPSGDDVTDHFESAVNADLKVFKDGKHYHVYDSAGGCVSGDEEMTRKDQVEDFIKEFNQ